MTLEQIQDEMSESELMPSRAADLGVFVSANFGRAADQYSKLSGDYARKFVEIRQHFKSDTACERAIENSELGVSLTYWKYQLKKAEQMQKALSNLVYVKTAEARNHI